ncbi:MAG: regulatory iron-sulfur-containing complex subunit RicT [Chloroflexota bacterium]
MATEEKSLVVGVRFSKAGKVYHFDASGFKDICAGDFVVVETSRGNQAGQVVEILEEPQQVEKWKPIIRKATGGDLVLRQIWMNRETEALERCRIKAREMGSYRDIKFVSAEFSLDGKRLDILYSNIGEGKVDMNPLRSAMACLYSRTKVEMHRIGPRDVAKIMGGLGACGLEERCCSRFLCDFGRVSIKKAKVQGVSLNPAEITGMCGRLRCCMLYEYEQYVEEMKTMPRLKCRVLTPSGEGKIVDLNPLNRSVTVEFEEQGRQEYSLDEVESLDEDDR